MTVQRGLAFAFVGALVAAAGFLIGRSLGRDTPTASEVGGTPATLTLKASKAGLPRFDSARALPDLATTVSEGVTETTDSELGGEESANAGSEVIEEPVKEEPQKKEPPKAPSSPEPDITVGGSEE